MVDSTKLDYGTIRIQRVHLDDLDHMGVMHNSRHGLLVERTIVEFWAEHGITIGGGGTTSTDLLSVVREFAIAYRKPVRRVGPVQVHVWVTEMDEVSRTYGFQLRSEDHRATYAEGTLVTVSIDRQTGRPAPMTPQSLRIANLLQRPPHDQDHLS